jgi:hypothetical protein
MNGKDSRLYGRFTLDFADSPKIAPLSDSAFRALVEMTLHSRRMLDDGFVDERIVARKWKPRAITELLSNDPVNPSLRVVDGGYRIHDFDEHQQTRADIEKKRTAGSKGGQASAQARASADGQAHPKLTTETETETETVLSKERTNPRSTRGTRVPSDFTISDDMRAWAATEVPHVDLDKKLAEWADFWRGVPGKGGVKIDWVATWKNGMRKQEEFALRDLARNPTAQPVKRRQFGQGAE